MTSSFYRNSLIASLLIALTGCTGGSSGSSSSGSGDQEPDPVVVEIPIAYVKRPLPEDPMQTDDLRDPLAFNPGAQLLMRSRAANTAAEIDITPQILSIIAAELGIDEAEIALDIKDLSPSFDGELLLFAVRAVPEPVDNNLENTTWNLWQYEFATETTSYLISSQATRNEAAIDGASQDIAPHSLPDGRIVFSSTRQSGSVARLAAELRPPFIAADESRRGPAALLHVLDPDNGSIEQISYNLSHDLDPTVIDSGEIVFSRWDNGPGNNRWSLYKINPSGRQLSLHYGFHSHDTGTPDTTAVQFTQPREMEDGRLMTLLRPVNSTHFGGDIVIIDADNFVEHDQAVWADQGNGGSGQQALTNLEVRSDDQLSPGGLFSAAFPLHDGSNRVLTSWSQCRALDANNEIVPCSLVAADAEPAPPLYGLWVYDPSENTQLPVVTPEEGFVFTEIVAAESRAFPEVPADEAIEVFDNSLVDSGSVTGGHGILRIDSVYNFDGIDNSDLDALTDTDVGIASRANPALAEYASRPARFIRLVKPVLLPDPDNDNFDIPNEAFGRSGAQRMREILGYAAVEPDGSVTVKVPANTPFMLSVLDEKGRRLGARHNVWMQLGPGEIRRCGGCHTRNSDLPHGRVDTLPPSANAGAQSLSVGSGTGIGFPNTKVDRDDYPTDYLDGGDIGQTMAEIYDLQRPTTNKSQAQRELDLELSYIDEWADTVNGMTADPALDYSYDPTWASNPKVVNPLDPNLSRTVINYVDHIQPIWERARTMENGGIQVNDADGNPAVDCMSCHRSNPDNNSPSEIIVPAGQLDLGSHIDDTYYRSYTELLFGDTERWLDAGGNAADRIRSCTEEQDDGMGGTTTVTIADPTPPLIGAILSSGGANNSTVFFNCFEGGSNCGVFTQQTTPPAACTEDGTVVTDPVSHNHDGWLSDAELRLISEWLDIGGQYYNDPFHSDLSP